MNGWARVPGRWSSKTVPGRALRVWIVLSSLPRRWKGSEVTVKPSIRYLAEMTGMTESLVCRGLKWLEDDGAISRSSTAGGHGKTTSYILSTETPHDQTVSDQEVFSGNPARSVEKPRPNRQQNPAHSGGQCRSFCEDLCEDARAHEAEGASDGAGAAASPLKSGGGPEAVGTHRKRPEPREQTADVRRLLAHWDACQVAAGGRVLSAQHRAAFGAALELAARDLPPAAIELKMTVAVQAGERSLPAFLKLLVGNAAALANGTGAAP